MADLRSFFRVSLAFVGLLLSVYALTVELLVSQDPGYKPFCDISEEISCTRVFFSKYGTGFGIVEPVLGKDSVFNIPNTIYGIVAYLVMIVLSLFTRSRLAARLVFVTSVVACLVNFYLMYLLFILKDLCLVCISTYVVNFVMLYESFRHVNRFAERMKVD